MVMTRLYELSTSSIVSTALSRLQFAHARIGRLSRRAIPTPTRTARQNRLGTGHDCASGGGAVLDDRVAHA